MVAEMRSSVLVAGSLVAAATAISLQIRPDSFASQLRIKEEVRTLGSGAYHTPSSVPELQILIPKSGSTKSVSGSLLIYNKSGRSVTLTLSKVIGLSNSALPRTIQLSDGQSKKISFSGSLSSSDGGGAVGAIYTSSGEAKRLLFSL